MNVPQNLAGDFQSNCTHISTGPCTTTEPVVGVGGSRRLRRATGGRTRVIYVRVSEDEERTIRGRAEEHGLSAQRFLIEAGLTGSAGVAADRRGAQREALRAVTLLAAMSNNVNQLAKWANTNQPFSDDVEGLPAEVRRATTIAAAAVTRLATSFEEER